MGMWVGRGRKARRCYGFDEISLVPGDVTINPNEVDTSWQLGPMQIKVPIIGVIIASERSGRLFTSSANLPARSTVRGDTPCSWAKTSAVNLGPSF